MMIRRVPVAEVMQKLRYSRDCGYLETADDWFRMLSRKMADRSAYELIEQGEILDPICITKNGTDLGNGHHRLCVAILRGDDTILVDDSHWYSQSSSAHQYLTPGVKHPDPGLRNIVLESLREELA